MSVAVERDQAFLDAVRLIAEDVAWPNADAVDRQARFPNETNEAVPRERALSAFVSTQFGARAGRGASNGSMGKRAWRSTASALGPATSSAIRRTASRKA